MSVKEQLKRLYRSFERSMAGESNKAVYLTSGHFSGSAGHFYPPTAITYDKPVNPTQLEFESAGAILSGRPADVRAVRQLDEIFGRMISLSAERTAPVAQSMVDDFRAHVGDLELQGVFRRVSARRPDGAPVAALTYTARHREDGSLRVQEIASPSLGGGR